MVTTDADHVPLFAALTTYFRCDDVEGWWRPRSAEAKAAPKISLES